MSKIEINGEIGAQVINGTGTPAVAANVFFDNAGSSVSSLTARTTYTYGEVPGHAGTYGFVAP